MIRSIFYYILLNLVVYSAFCIIFLFPFVPKLALALLGVILFYISVNVSNLLWSNINIPKELEDPKNRCVLITGCDSGFGNLLAKRLNSYGFHVFAGCLFPNGDGAVQLKKSCPRNLDIIKLDVTKGEDVDAARIFVEKNTKNRQLWAIVNNAGILISTEIEMGDMRSFTRQMDVNCLGTIRVTKAFLPLLRQSKGRVVNVGSLAGRYCIPGMVAYSMSKAAVISFSEGLRRELKKWSIDVISIEPHLFRTNLCNDQVQKKQLLDAWKATPEVVREAYGDCYLDGYRKFLDKVLGSARPQINRVVDAMMMAVTHKFVAPEYRVMGDLERIRIAVYNFLPVRFLDTLSHNLSAFYTGKPALLKAIYEKKNVHANIKNS